MRGVILLLAALGAAPALAQAETFEVLGIGNGDVNGSRTQILSFRWALAGSETQSAVATEKNARPGLRLRFDVMRSTYETNYNRTPGTGSVMGYRLLLAYGVPVNADTTVTVTGGISRRDVDVRPVTANSPSDVSDVGPFASLELEYSPERLGRLEALLEHDSVGANYGALSLFADLGPSLRVGPTFNYISEGDYSRRAAGLSAVYALSDQFEMKVTAANAAQQIVGIPDKDADYLELQFRSVF
jgi:hypothetical protein